MCETLRDINNLPSDIITKLYEGEWTCSYLGHAFHNMALDESHECGINKKLKQLTPRPSEHRTVAMANFMSYLEQFIAQNISH